MSNKKIIDFSSGSISDSTQGYLGDISNGALTRTSFKAMKDYFTSGSLSTPSWNSTLAVNATTSLAPTYLQNNNSYFISYFQPNNYAPLSNTERFYSWIDSNFTNPISGRKDVVGSWWSYNMGPAEALVTSGEAAFGFISETFFEQAGAQNFEFHMPIMVDTAGVYHRLNSMYTRRNDGYTYQQMQIQNISYRFQDVNDGTKNWFDANTDPVVGGTFVAFDSSHGTGGAGGTQANIFRLRMFSGTGNNFDIMANAGDGTLSTQNDMYLTPVRFLNVPNNVNFGSSDYYSSHDVYFQTANTTVGKGYYFFQAGQSNVMLVLKNGQNESWQPTVNVFPTRLDGRVTFGLGTFAAAGAFVQFVGSASPFAQINLATGSTPASPNNGDIWYDTSLRFKSGSTTIDVLHPTGVGSFTVPNKIGSNITFDQSSVYNSFDNPLTSMSIDTGSAVKNTSVDAFYFNNIQPTFPSGVYTIGGNTFDPSNVNLVRLTYYSSSNITVQYIPYSVNISPYQLILNRASALGYTAPNGTIQAADIAAINSLQSTGLFAKMNYWYSFCSDSDSNFSTLNWINPLLYPATKQGSIGYVTKNGYTGGTGSYLDTGFHPGTQSGSISSPVGAHFSIFIPNSSSFDCANGVNELGNNYINIQESTGSFEEADLGNASGGTGFNSWGASRFFTGSFRDITVVRENSSILKLYVNGTLVTSSANTSTFFPTGSMFLLARNSVGTAANFSNGGIMRLGYASFGGALTATEVSASYNIKITRFNAIQ